MLMRFNTKGTQPKDRSRATNPAAQHLLVPPPQTRAARSHPRLLELGAPPAALRAGGVQGEGQGQHRAHCHEPQGGHWGFISWALWSQTSGCRGVEASSSTPHHLLSELFFFPLKCVGLREDKTCRTEGVAPPGAEQPGVPTSTAPVTPGTEISLQPPPSH